MSKVEKKEYLEPAVSGFNVRTAMEEASRCLLCIDAPCSKSCPANTDPEKFIRSIRFRNFKGAAETIREANILGGCCALVCPYENLCEEACSRTGIDKPIEIGKLQKFAMEQEKLFNMEILKAGAEKPGKVACIGGGPASLACGAKLAEKGYSVTIFDENEKAGGVLTYGITPSRLPQEVVDEDIKHIEKLGVSFIFNTKIGRDISLEELKQQGFDAIFLGIGLWKGKIPEVKGNDLEGVMSAVDYLREARTSKGAIKRGNHVIVIGCGDVALDCAVTAKLLEAERVTIVYRRTIEEAPATMAEIKHFQSLGGVIITEFAPAEILGKEGKVTGLAANGRDGYSGLKLKADTIVYAVGQTSEDLGYAKNIELDEKGRIVADSEIGATNLEGIFAAGDIVNGGKTVVEAVAQGKYAAEAIDSYLETKMEVK